MSRVIVRGLTIDNGGSEIRLLPEDKSAPEGVTKLTNDFASISEKNFRVKETTDRTELCRVKKAPRSEYLGLVACGLTGKSYDGEMMSITSQDTKTGNINYYRQFIFGVAKDALDAYLENPPGEKVVKKGLFGGKTIVTEDEPIFHYALVTCIPIKEHSGNKDCASILKSNLKGEYVVEFPLVQGSPEVRFVISSDYLGVVPEGGVAVTGLRGILTDEDISLVVDMGHITTDIGLFQGKSLLGKVASSSYAGSTLIANVRSALADEGYMISDSQAEKVIMTGKVKRGVKEDDVSAIIAAQKEFFVKNYLTKEIIEILNMNKIKAKQVQYFIPIGAGMNETKGQGSIRKAIVDACGLESAEVKVLSKDLRYVNVEMAAAFTKMLADKARRELEA